MLFRSEDYFAYGYVPDPKSIYRAVRKLAPAHCLVLRRGEALAAPRVYWRPRFAEHHRGRSWIRIMDKRAVISELHAAIDMRLFGNRHWLAEGDDLEAINTKLVELGLVERVDDPGLPGSIQYTSLGKELPMDLITVFLGVMYELDVPIILEWHGLLDDHESDLIFERMDPCNPARMLRPYVQRAYREHFKVPRYLV